jgi:BirA family biotin operon repressor/biotin-[acetyl-CoA-carboxylase] ligase
MAPPIRRLESTHSTNDEARAWARDGAPHLAFVTAREQSGGRGRRGRSWASPPGRGFYGSLIVRPRAETGHAAPMLSRWTLGAAVGVARALDELGQAAKLKWPNDVLLNGKKVAGVLCEAEWHGDTPAFLIVGVGLNVSHQAGDLPARPVFPATSLLLESGRDFGLERAEQVLVPALRQVAEEVGSGGWNAVRAEWESLCAHRGELISVADEGGEGGKYFGVLRGLDESGALVVATADGERRVVVGDVAFE